MATLAADRQRSTTAAAARAKELLLDAARHQARLEDVHRELAALEVQQRAEAGELGDPYARSRSTRWVSRTSRVPAPAEGQQPLPPKASSSTPLEQWDRRSPLTLTVTYRGGAECWYEIRARGRIYRRDGATALHDIMRDIYGGIYGRVVPTKDTSAKRGKRSR